MGGIDSARERFEVLFKSHYEAIYRYAVRRVDSDHAADVAAEVFLVAWRRFDEIPRDVLPWLYGVARRVLANDRRSVERTRRLHGRVSVRAEGISPPEPVDPADAAAETLRLDAAFRTLSPGDREVLMLAAWEGLDVTGIATVLGCGRPAAAMRLSRARRRLQTALGADHEER